MTDRAVPPSSCHCRRHRAGQPARRPPPVPSPRTRPPGRPGTEPASTSGSCRHRRRRLARRAAPQFARDRPRAGQVQGRRDRPRPGPPACGRPAASRSAPTGSLGYATVADVRRRGEPAGARRPTRPSPAPATTTSGTRPSIPNDPCYAVHALQGVPTSTWCGVTAGVERHHRARSAQVVAVVDSGVDATAPDLAGQRAARASTRPSNPRQQRRSGPGEPACADPAATGHGTFVASVAAADTNNGYGIDRREPGAPGSCRSACSTQCGSGFDSNIAAGITWAADHGATVINLSLGRPGPRPRPADGAAVRRRQGHPGGRGRRQRRRARRRSTRRPTPRPSRSPRPTTAGTSDLVQLVRRLGGPGCPGLEHHRRGAARTLRGRVDAATHRLLLRRRRHVVRGPASSAASSALLRTEHPTWTTGADPLAAWRSRHATRDRPGSTRSTATATSTPTPRSAARATRPAALTRGIAPPT